MLLPGCKKEAPPQARPPAEVSAIKIEPKDTPVGIESVGSIPEIAERRQDIRNMLGALLKLGRTNEGLWKSAINFETGDFLFAPAGVYHRFERISEDATIWMISYGADNAAS